MKRKLAIILALVLAVSLLVPAAVSASASDNYKVTFNLHGENAGHTAVDATSNYSNYIAGSTTVHSMFATWAPDAQVKAKATFGGVGDTLETQFNTFMGAAIAGGDTWTAVLDTTGLGFSSGAKAFLADSTKTLSDLAELETPITVTYDASAAGFGTYTLTVTAEVYVYSSSESGDTTPAVTEETTTADDGTEATEKKDAEGNVTEVEVKVPDDVTDTTVPVTADEDTPITIDIPDGKTVTVEIPVEDVKPTTVVKLVKADGTEEILPATAMTEDGLKLVLDDDVTIKIEDVEVTNDIPEDAWYKDAMDYVEAREILEDIPAADVAPLDDCDRGTFTTMLYNLCRQPDASTATGDFEDVKTADFYSDAVAWAKENNIVKGVSETEFDGTSPITREQIVTILWRYAGSPAATAVDTGASDWAADAMSWAVSIGLIKGNGDDTGYRPQDQARVAEAATIIMDFVNGGYAGTSN